MLLEPQTHPVGPYPEAALSPLLNREAREAANRWLARFAPLLEGDESLTGAECRERLALIEALQPEASGTLEGLRAQATQGDVPLLSTLSSAVAEIEALQDGLRRRLALLSPGDPEGQLDLGALQQKLAEAAARREVADVAPLVGLTPKLHLRTSPANWGAAAGLGVFGLGWTAFTTLHATLFIGGFSRVIGVFALGFLLFYAMFWAVGFAMLRGAYLQACDEEIEIDGHTLTLIRTFAGRASRREVRLAPGARAQRVAASTVKPGNRNPAAARLPGTDLAVKDENGREVRFGAGRSADEQERLMARINEYLASRPAI